MPSRPSGAIQVNPYFLNAIRSLGFSFDEQKKRRQFWKKKGTAQILAIPRRSWLTPDEASILLKSAGMPADEIQRFISEAGSAD